jgi:ribonuclease VapC
MVIETSAFSAIALREPTSKALLEATMQDQCTMAAPSLFECHIVLRNRLGEEAEELIRTISKSLGLVIVPFDEEQVAFAADAFLRFGKGRHKAALNFGDCMSYALAKLRNEPLLFIGDEFTHTDVRAVNWKTS